MSLPVQISEKDGIRYLHLGGSSVQSAMRLHAPYDLELEYTRAMMGFLLFHPAPRQVGLIGLGGGSLAKFIHRYLPDSSLTVLEIHPEVITAARAWFELPGDDGRLRVIQGDGAAYVQAHPDSLDVLLVDGFDAEDIVAALTTLKFYRACHAMLRPGGVAVFNLWGSDRFFSQYCLQLARAFGGHTLLLPAVEKANVVVFAFRGPLPDTGFAHLAGLAAQLENRYGLGFDDFLVRMGECNTCSEQAFILGAGPTPDQ
jgi:spermidine synthase